jgi:hypothetical protein
MAVGKILRKPLKAGLEIEGEQVISGKYAEAIAKFDTVALGEVVENPDVKIKLANPDIVPPS